VQGRTDGAQVSVRPGALNTYCREALGTLGVGPDAVETLKAETRAADFQLHTACLITFSEACAQAQRRSIISYAQAQRRSGGRAGGHARTYAPPPRSRVEEKADRPI
jgi:hypothetical protein